MKHDWLDWLTPHLPSAGQEDGFIVGICAAVLILLLVIGIHTLVTD